MYEGEQKLLRAIRVKATWALACLGGVFLILAVIFGWYTYKALVFYTYYLSGV